MGSVRACGYSPIVVVRASRHHRVGGKNGLLSLQPQGARGHSISWVVRAGKGPPLLPPKKEVVEGGGIISACFVGLLTGLSVVIFNNVVHEIRDLCWDGLPSRGGLRVLALENKWERIILIPTCGGLVVSLLNVFRSALEDGNSGLKGLLKAVAAAVTLGTGNSLGPEGPSVDIGCFFAVESVLWPSPAAESSLSLTNTTSTVILSAVIASVVSEIGLGSEPAFTIPNYDFRSPTELPLYLLLGIFCGVVSLSLSWCTSWMIVATDKIQKTLGMPKAVFPVVGGFSVGVIALIYPEVLYWGFENVDTLLETRAFVKGLDVDLLLQLIAVKVVATSLCRASGLVGGYYAPSLFIGAATGMAYGKLLSSLISHLNPIFHLSGILDVASPQAYALVGMAATLAGVCEVPLTAVLLLFELTQDYRIVLPLLGAVGVSSWITSWSIKSKDNSPKPDTDHLSMHNFDQCITKKLLVSQAMKTQYVTVLMNTLLTQVVTLMLAEKQSCAIIVDDHNLFIGLLTLGDIQEFCKLSKETNKMPEELKVSQVCCINDFCETATLTPMMNLHSAELIMNTHGANQLPVISEDLPVGILDRECINIACRALATTEYLSTLTN
ncbi:putative CBS domain, chloride channel, voltage gated, chloride channel, core [Helianthus debilis subsp. tardiflorus]